MGGFIHEPVMLRETLEWIRPAAGGVYCDGTLGGGGHSEAILKAAGPGAALYGIDRDETAVAAASERLKEYPGFRAIHGNFHDAKELLAEAGAPLLDGVLLDLGVSSPQLDTPERGFSYHEDAPLETTFDLVAAVDAAIPRAVRRKEDGHPARRTFQAVRIAVNDELTPLDQALCDLTDCLKSGGRICVITFHSLEDRLVKRCFQRLQNPCVCPPKAPVCTCGRKPQLRVLAGGAVKPTEEETARNPRARSAKLRAAEKI